MNYRKLHTSEQNSKNRTSQRTNLDLATSRTKIADQLPQKRVALQTGRLEIWAECKFRNSVLNFHVPKNESGGKEFERARNRANVSFLELEVDWKKLQAGRDSCSEWAIRQWTTGPIRFRLINSWALTTANINWRIRGSLPFPKSRAPSHKTNYSHECDQKTGELLRPIVSWSTQKNLLGDLP
jgi:hypothetical protein